MSTSNADTTPRESECTHGPGPITGDELYMMSGDVAVLCSVPYPSTRWIATTHAVELSACR